MARARAPLRGDSSSAPSSTQNREAAAAAATRPQRCEAAHGLRHLEVLDYGVGAVRRAPRKRRDYRLLRRVHVQLARQQEPADREAAARDPRKKACLTNPSGRRERTWPARARLPRPSRLTAQRPTAARRAGGPAVGAPAAPAQERAPPHTAGRNCPSRSRAPACRTPRRTRRRRRPRGLHTARSGRRGARRSRGAPRARRARPTLCAWTQASHNTGDETRRGAKIVLTLLISKNVSERLEPRFMTMEAGARHDSLAVFEGRTAVNSVPLFCSPVRLLHHRRLRDFALDVRLDFLPPVDGADLNLGACAHSVNSALHAFRNTRRTIHQVDDHVAPRAVASPDRFHLLGGRVQVRVEPQRKDC